MRTISDFHPPARRECIHPADLDGSNSTRGVQYNQLPSTVTLFYLLRAVLKQNNDTSIFQHTFRLTQAEQPTQRQRTIYVAKQLNPHIIVHLQDSTEQTFFSRIC